MINSNVCIAKEKMIHINDKPSQEACHTPSTASLTLASTLCGQVGPEDTSELAQKVCYGQLEGRQLEWYWLAHKLGLNAHLEGW